MVVGIGSIILVIVEDGIDKFVYKVFLVSKHTPFVLNTAGLAVSAVPYSITPIHI